MTTPKRPKSKARFVFDVYVNSVGQHCWRLWARNGRIVADSGESYKRRRDCVAMCDALTDWLYKSEVIIRPQ